jgi:hypothetical protein
MLYLDCTASRLLDTIVALASLPHPSDIRPPPAVLATLAPSRPFSWRHHVLWRLQGTGGLLIRKIDGDYQNVVGFPASSFMMLLESLIEEDEDFLSI